MMKRENKRGNRFEDDLWKDGKEIVLIVFFALLGLIIMSFYQMAYGTPIEIPPTPAIPTVISDSGTFNADNYASSLNIRGSGGITTKIIGNTLTINGSGSGGGFTNETLPVPPMGEYTISKQSTIITNFQKGHGWTNVSGNACTSLDNTTNYMFTNQSLQITTFGNSTACSIRSPTISPVINLKNQIVSTWIMLNDTTNINDLRLTATGDNFVTFVNYRLWGASFSSVNYLTPNTWYRVTFSPTQTDQTGSPDLTSINKIQWRLQDSGSGHKVRMWVSSLAYFPVYDYPIVSYTFDDIDQDAYTNGIPILDEYHFPGTIYFVQNYVGLDPQHMTLTELRTLQNKNWDISPHTQTHPFLTQLSTQQLYDELHGPKIYAIENGFSQGADHLAYPHGAFNDTVIKEAKLFYKTGRSIAEGCPTTACPGLSETLPPGDPYRLRILNVLSTTSLTAIHNRINLAYQNHDWLILLFHHVVPTGSSLPDTTYVNVATLQNITDTIHNKGFRVMTISQVMNDFSTGPRLQVNTKNCGSQFVNSIDNNTGSVGCATVSGSSTLDTLQNVGTGNISVYAGNSSTTNFQIKKMQFNTGFNATNGTSTATISPDIRYLQPQPLFYKSGTWTGQGSTTSDGILNGMWSQAMTNETTARQIDANGLYFKRTTASGTNNEAGITSATFTERQLNPDLFIKFRINSLTDSRYFMGFTSSSSTPLTGEDPCNARSCFLFGFKVNQTNFQIIKNDGVGATVFVNVTASDTSIHTIELKADNTNSRFGYSLDGGAFSYETSDIPGASTNLNILNEVQTTKATTKNIDTWFIQVTQDK